MNFKDKRVIAVNVAGGAIILGALATFVNVSTSRPQVPLCDARYERAQMMALHNGGVPISSTDIQSASSGFDRGVLERLTVEEVRSAPSRFAMRIDLPIQVERGEENPGVSFPWTPSTLEGAQQACLTYDLYLPRGFDFASGGTLPGLYAVEKDSDFGSEVRVDMRVAWTGNGDARMKVRAHDERGTAEAAYPFYDKELPRGEWVRVNQELILNKPGEADGIARTWIDGRLQSERKGLNLRNSSDVVVAGVASVVERAGGRKTPSESITDPVFVSPFVIRWR